MVAVNKSPPSPAPARSLKDLEGRVYFAWFHLILGVQVMCPSNGGEVAVPLLLCSCVLPVPLQHWWCSLSHQRMRGRFVLGWCLAVVASDGAVGVQEKKKVQDLGLRCDGGGFGALPRRRQWQAVGLRWEEHGDVPRSTRHNDNGFADGKSLHRLTKPFGVMVLSLL
jgi:hypothetical protein